MKIITLNTWGIEGPFPQRLNLIIQNFKDIDPDIILLQEDFQGNIISCIKEFGWKYCLHDTESGLAICSKFVIKNPCSHIYYQQSPLETYARKLIHCIIQIENCDVLFVSTHLSWKKEDEHTRILQVKELCDYIEQKKISCIIGGDFNADYNSESIKEMKQSSFTSLFHELHPDKFCITWDNQNPFISGHRVIFSNRCVDYLWANSSLREKMKILRSNICLDQPAEDIFPSDHYGVYAEIVLCRS